MQKRLWFIAAAFLGAAASTTADAQLLFDFEQNGGDVVATATGRFDTGLVKPHDPSDGFGAFIVPDVAFFGIGVQDTVTNYDTTNAPVAFSDVDDLLYSSSSSGLGIGMNGAGDFIFLATSYVSGAPISATAVFADATLESLGLTPADYHFYSGGNAIRLTIGQKAGAVPEPAAWAEMLAGCGAIGCALRRQRKTSRSGSAHGRSAPPFTPTACSPIEA